MQFNLLNFLILNYWKYMNILIVYYSINIMFPSKLVSQNHHPNMFVKVVWKKHFYNYGSKHKSFLANQLLPKPTFKKPYWKKKHFSTTFPKHTLSHWCHCLLTQYTYLFTWGPDSLRIQTLGISPNPSCRVLFWPLKFIWELIICHLYY